MEMHLLVSLTGRCSLLIFKNYELMPFGYRSIPFLLADQAIRDSRFKTKMSCSFAGYNECVS